MTENPKDEYMRPAHELAVLSYRSTLRAYLEGGANIEDVRARLACLSRKDRKRELKALRAVIAEAFGIREKQ